MLLLEAFRPVLKWFTTTDEKAYKLWPRTYLHWSWHEVASSKNRSRTSLFVLDTDTLWIRAPVPSARRLMFNSTYVMNMRRFIEYGSTGPPLVCHLSLLSRSSSSGDDGVDRPVRRERGRRNVSQDKDLINTLNHNEIVAAGTSTPTKNHFTIKWSTYQDN